MLISSNFFSQLKGFHPNFQLVCARNRKLLYFKRFSPILKKNIICARHGLYLTILTCIKRKFKYIHKTNVLGIENGQMTVFSRGGILTKILYLWLEMTFEMTLWLPHISIQFCYYFDTRQYCFIRNCKDFNSG